eukprot:236248-Alexandrium_andersonii.AAC.1
MCIRDSPGPPPVACHHLGVGQGDCGYRSGPCTQSSALPLANRPVRLRADCGAPAALRRMARRQG